MNVKVWAIGALAVGALLVIIGVVILTVVPLTIRREIRQNVHLGFDENGTYNEITQRWIEPKYSMELKIWVVSVTNPEDVVQRGSYPKLIEKGPYAYREHQKKVKVEFMRNNTRVLYRNKHYYFFDRNASCSDCDLNDLVTIPNILFQAIVDFASKSSPAVRLLIEFVLRQFKRETPFITAAVGEILFDGYRDPMIEAMCNQSIIRALCIAAALPTRIRFMENGTDDGDYLIDTGLKGADKIGKVYAWNGRNETPWWSTTQARMINGTDGELFPSSLSASNDLPIFVGELGRSIYLRYDKSVTYEKIPAYRYVIPPSIYDPFLPENKGFCSPETPRYFSYDIQPDGCLPAGMFDIGRTKPGSPRIYLSGVHFYNSPPQVYQNFTGFAHPDSNDQAYLDIEPYTGVTVDALEASQINVGMIGGNLRMLAKMPRMIVPVLWLNERVILDEETKEDLGMVVTPSALARNVGILLVGIGMLLWIAFLVISLRQVYLTRNADDEEHLIEGDNENRGD